MRKLCLALLAMASLLVAPPCHAGDASTDKLRSVMAAARRAPPS